MRVADAGESPGLVSRSAPNTASEATVITAQAAATHRARLEVLVNNAGIAPVAPRLLDVTEALFDKTIGVEDDAFNTFFSETGAGKHVLTEARMARNLAEAELMLAEAKLHPNLVTQIVPAPMSLPFDATIIDLLQAGTLGTLREVCLTATTDSLADNSLPLSWRQDLTLSGKNTLYMGIYYEIALRWLRSRGMQLLLSRSHFDSA